MFDVTLIHSTGRHLLGTIPPTSVEQPTRPCCTTWISRPSHLATKCKYTLQPTVYTVHVCIFYLDGIVLTSINMCVRFSYYGNGKTSADTLNSNEKILVASPVPGTWKVL